MNVLLLALLTCVVSIIDMVVGFGTSTIMVPILVFFISPFDALFIAGVLDFFNNIWKILFFRKTIDWSIVWPFAIAAVLGAVIGATITFALPVVLFKRLLGALLFAYVAYFFYKPTFVLPKTATPIITGGALYGFFAGVIGMGGPIRTAFLSAFNLAKGIYVATNGVIAGAVDAARVIVYWVHGNSVHTANYFVVLIGLILLSAMSAYVGKLLIDILDQKLFRKIIMLFLFAIGVQLLLLS